MASPHDFRRPGVPKRPRRLVPVGVVVTVYFVAGTLWVVGSDPAADMIVEARSVSRWIVELGLGVWFVTITTLAMWLSMRERAQRLHSADELTEEADARTEEADARTDEADARTDEADARTDEADARTGEAEARTDEAEARTAEADARTDEADARTDDKARQLEASEDRSRLQATALSGTSSAVVVSARDGTIEWVNEAFETLSGYSASEAVGASSRLLQSGVEDDAFFEGMWETILAGRVWRGEVVNRRKNGELRTVAQTITPVVGSSGTVQNFVTTLEDVTERVQAAQDLEASRVRLQALVDHALDAIVLADDEGRYVAVNPAFCALTGYSSEELLELGPADLAAPDRQPDDVVVQFSQFVEAGSESGVFVLQHKDGHLVETEYRAVAGIQPGVHLSVLRDVTERNSILRALTVAESEFRGLAESAADIVTKLRIEGDGEISVDYVNPAASTILGHAREELYADSDLLLNLLGHGDAGALESVKDLVRAQTVPVKLATVQVERGDGRLVWLEVHSTLTGPTVEPATIQLVARDVTARSEMMEALEKTLQDQLTAAEQLRALNAMKDTFLQTVSHELRTPLTSILGFAQLLADPQQGLSPENTRTFHQRILSNAERLRRLLDDLLDVDRFTRGHVEPHRRPTDLTEAIERTVEDVDLDDHPMNFDLRPITMDLDPTLVERLVASLLRNIVQHTPPGSQGWISTRATDDGVELIVDDDGPGIPEADRQRVLEPFQQGADAASSPQPGTGIGLSLVNTFAQLHGGDLVLTESPAGGTRATVRLVNPVSSPDPTKV